MSVICNFVNKTDKPLQLSNLYVPDFLFHRRAYKRSKLFSNTINLYNKLKVPILNLLGSKIGQRVNYNCENGEINSKCYKLKKMHFGSYYC